MRPEVQAWLNRVTEIGADVRPQDDNRPVTDYPQMPSGTCYLSARFLAECFPELRVAYGRLTFYIQGEYVQLDHAWNVTPDGRIIDPTWTPPDGAENITYREIA